MPRRLVPLVVWVGFLGALLAVMAAAGDGPLASPPLAEPGGWSAWAADRGGPAAALAVVRLVVMAVAAWLLVVTAVSFALAATRRTRDLDVVELLGLPIVRRVVHGALGIGLVGATAAGAAGFGGTERGRAPIEVSSAPSEPPELVPLDPVETVPLASPPPPPPTSETRATPSALPPTSVTTTTGPATPSTAATSVTPGSLPDGPPSVLSPVGTTRTPAPVPGPASPRMWTVQPGEHFWSIARSLVEEVSGDGIGATAVAPYWRLLIAENRAGLADPSNPDLLFPGDRLVVPPVPSGR